MLNKKSMLFLIIISFIGIIQAHKYYLGYSPIAYIFNIYKNTIQNHDNLGLDNIKLDLPISLWYIKNVKRNTIIFQGMISDSMNINASLDFKYSKKTLFEVKQICMGKNHVIKKGLTYIIDCYPIKDTLLKSYRIIYIPNKLLLFMYNYQSRHEWLYKRLFDSIELL